MPSTAACRPVPSKRPAASRCSTSSNIACCTISKFFGSSFIEVMFSLWTRLNSRPGAKFALAGVAPYCKEVLTITHLDTLWQLHPSVPDAIKAIGRA